MNQAAVAQGEARTFAVMRYASEMDTVGRQNVGRWSQVESLLSKREFRLQKTGNGLLPVSWTPC
ncbi:hypothetical protein P3T32_002022 [Ralstonia sp. GP73]|jgi:hypothetical protein|uniref:Uncharacterized protein n=2 Tax=Ralstonia TaxID=48736 RepID=A0AAD2BPV0_9RALS|nr:hypothetical protein [Ralstonia sp. GP73]CAJ0708735.1 hypothetical protein LMG7143_00811 [Ralstonia sp. LMG 18095]CAJ0795982.1 hypothetical protein R77560_02807 [Ralstonia sp. LMG 18095]CAJ0806006.1 hypothetical protein LMG18095_04362 [Ralstonia sp. LMG 18095]CAJ0858120.1 hypothetical protein R6138_00522 [Ralstonia sp. LMG 18095]